MSVSDLDPLSSAEQCCFFFKQQQWQEKTGRLINGLQDASGKVLQELESNAEIVNRLQI